MKLRLVHQGVEKLMRSQCLDSEVCRVRSVEISCTCLKNDGSTATEKQLFSV